MQVVSSSFLRTPPTPGTHGDILDYFDFLAEIVTVIPSRKNMPRQARLDAPGTLHHVIIRGIEQGKINV
jgi:hypothetical protein